MGVVVHLRQATLRLTGKLCLSIALMMETGLRLLLLDATLVNSLDVDTTVITCAAILTQRRRRIDRGHVQSVFALYDDITFDVPGIRKTVRKQAALHVHAVYLQGLVRLKSIADGDLHDFAGLLLVGGKVSRLLVKLRGVDWGSDITAVA